MPAKSFRCDLKIQSRQKAPNITTIAKLQATEIFFFFMYIFFSKSGIVCMNDKRSPLMYFSCGDTEARGMIEKLSRDQSRGPDGKNL